MLRNKAVGHRHRVGVVNLCGKVPATRDGVEFTLLVTEPPFGDRDALAQILQRQARMHECVLHAGQCGASITRTGVAANSAKSISKLFEHLPMG